MNSDLASRLERENLKIASLSKRIIAMSIDDLLVSFLVVLAFSNQFMSATSYEEVLKITNSLFGYIFVAYTLYHWIFVALYGTTLGKMAVKIRVVDIDTFDKPSFSKALLRSVVRNFDEMFFYLGMMYAFVDPFNRAIHDIVGRVVIVENN